MPLKGVEEDAADLLKQWLIENGHSVEWEAITPDPPDLAFEVNGLERWAVEVTELQQYYSEAAVPSADATNGAKVQRRERGTVTMSLFRMIAKVNTLLASETLEYRYLVNFSGPVLAPSLRKVEKRIVDYVRSGKTVDEVLDEHGRVEIKVYPLMPSVPGKVVTGVGFLRRFDTGG